MIGPELDDSGNLVSLESSKIKDFPYNCVGIIKVTIGTAVEYGTGFLISPELVMTVARVICDIFSSSKD
jgi:hypothetical protein